MEMKWFFCIANMILDSELLLIIIIMLLIIILLSIIFRPLVPMSHLDTFRHCIVVVFRAYERVAQHIIIYTPPPAVLECWNTVNRRLAFSNFFLPPNEERTSF